MRLAAVAKRTAITVAYLHGLRRKRTDRGTAVMHPGSVDEINLFLAPLLFLHVLICMFALHAGC